MVSKSVGTKVTKRKCQIRRKTSAVNAYLLVSAGRHFYGTENVIWAGFGPIGNTEKKKLGPIMSTIEDGFFMFSVQKKF